MRKTACVCALWTMLAASAAHAGEFYVAPDGSDSAPGSREQPFATVERAQMAAAPGDTVWIRGGVYRFSGTNRAVGVAFTKSGTRENPIRYFAYADEVPIFDLFEFRPQERVTGLDVRCNSIHLRGLEVRGVRQLIVGDSWTVRIRGDGNVIERLNVHDGEAPGIFITSGAGNLILNCDSHHNYDPLESGGNADGFGCHSTGADNVLRGCRAWFNSDDGFDFINAPGTCTVERSWAFRNGFVPDTTKGAGNGAGFKSGGFGSPPKIPSTGVPRHVVRFNLAFRNRSQGFYANHHPGGLDFLNNTAFANGMNYDMLVEGGTSTHKLHNNIAAGSGGTVRSFSGGDDDNNTWTLPVMVGSDDFAGMDDTEALAPRQADGSLPEIEFMRLVKGSDLVDRGIDVGQPFTGGAPDLGAFELGLSAVPVPASSMDAGEAMPVDAGVEPTTPPRAAGPAGARGSQPTAAEAGSLAPTPAGGASVTGDTSAPAGDPDAATDTNPPAAESCSCRSVGSPCATSPAPFALAVLCVWSIRRQRRARTRRA